MQFYLKIHQNGDKKLAAICDEEIKGADLYHNGVKIKVKENFYGNELFVEDELFLELLNCRSINAFGKNICDILIKKKLVHSATVLWIDHENKKIGHVIIIL